MLSVAIILTLITCIFVPPDMKYLEYFDYTTLVCLFSILIVVVGLKSTNVFSLLTEKLVGLFHTTRSVIAFLILCTFFFDMIVANDMSLITLLPLTYMVLHSTNNDKYLALTFVLQTIAANMGGMLTPYGNPQNLYLYSYYNISISEFFQILLPQGITVLILLVICCAFIKKEPIKIKKNSNLILDKKRLCIYLSNS